METVSYLTINDETKEIVDLVSRNTIEDIGAIVSTHDNNIKQLQLNMSPGGALPATIEDAQQNARDAYEKASSVEELIQAVDDKTVSIEQTANNALSQANSAQNKADYAWNKANETASLIDSVNAKANSAVNVANAIWLEMDDALNTIGSVQQEISEINEAAAENEDEIDTITTSIGKIQNEINQTKKNAKNTLTKILTFDSIIDTFNWFVKHCTSTRDSSVDSSKKYYTYSQTTKTITRIEPEGTESPYLEGWYEIDETIQDFLSSHFLETPSEFYILAVDSGWKILISSDSNSSNGEGVFIISPDGSISQAFTDDGIVFNEEKTFTIGDDNAQLTFDGNGNISLDGTGVNLKENITLGTNEIPLSQVLQDLNTTIVSLKYGKGSSSTDYSDIQQWSTQSPVWTSDSYIWMQISYKNGSSTYICIQGAMGPKGETGPVGETGPRGIGIESVDISYGISQSELIMPEDDKWVGSINDLNEMGSSGQFDSQYYNYDNYEGDLNQEPDSSVTSEDDSGQTPDSFMTVLGSLKQGTWLWTRTITYYTDDTSTVSYQKTYIGKDGLSSQVATVTIVPSEIDWKNKTAKLTAQLIIDGEEITPDGYYWTEGAANGKRLGIEKTLLIKNFDKMYYCSVEW